MRLYQNDPEIVKEYFLIHSSPDVVHNFIEQLVIAEKEFSPFTELSSELEIELLERNEPLINLALAKYGYSREIFKALYPNAPEAIKLALLSNPHIFANNPIDYSSWMNLWEFGGWLIKEKNSLALFIFFSNPFLDTELINNLYDKTGAFEDIDEKLWQLLMHYTAKNKKIHENRTDNDVDFQKIFELNKPCSS